MSIDITKTDAILGEVMAERLEQDSRGYTPEHDEEHGFFHLSDISSFYGTVGSMQAQHGELDEAREKFLKAATVMVAAVELIDRAIATEKDLKK